MHKLQEEKKESEKQFKNQEKLKKQLNEEIQNKLIAEQYAKYEKEKSQIVSDYKDKLLEDLRSTLKYVFRQLKFKLFESLHQNRNKHYDLKWPKRLFRFPSFWLLFIHQWVIFVKFEKQILFFRDLQNSAVEQIVNFWEAEEDQELEKKFTGLSTPSSISDESSSYDTMPWKEETSQTNVSEVSRPRSDKHGFKNNLYNSDRERNRVFHIEQDLVSLPNDDQPISENSYFLRAPKLNWPCQARQSRFFHDTNSYTYREPSFNLLQTERQHETRLVLI